MNLPIWEPSQERIDRANMNRFVRFVREETGNEDIQRYAPLYDFSIRSPEKFWPLVWEFCGIRASGQFEPVIENPDQMPGARFYPNVKLNFAENLLRFRDDKPALIFRNEWRPQRQYSYAELHAEVGRMRAGAQAGRGSRSATASPASAQHARDHRSPCWPPPRWAPSGPPARPTSASTACSTVSARSSPRCCSAPTATSTTARPSTAWTRSAACSSKIDLDREAGGRPLLRRRRRICPACAMP